MRHFLFFVTALLLAISQVQAQSVFDYECWLDDDISSPLTGSVNGNNFSIAYDMSYASVGIHYLNLRLKNAEGEWGAPYRKMFFTTPAVNDAVKFEYWIDNDYISKTEGDITENNASYSIPLNEMKEGFHRFSYRLQQLDGQWGSVYSQLFFYSSRAGFSNFEYWIDNDYANKVTGTTSSETLAFSVNLDGLTKKEYHFLNLRVRDGNGDWGSVYRKLFFNHENNSPAKILGYTHSLDGVDLGYAKLEHNPSGIYTFTVDVPEPQGFSMPEAAIAFDGDKLSYALTDSIDYHIQIESEIGWAPTTTFSFESDFGFSTMAEEMTVPSVLSFTRPTSLQFKAVKFTSDGQPVYLKIDHKAAIDIYKDGEKVLRIPANQTSEVCTLDLLAGTYYAVIYDVVTNTDPHSPNALDTVFLRLMENINVNKCETPTVKDYDGRCVHISTSQGFDIVYSFNDDEPLTDGANISSEGNSEAIIDLGGLNKLRVVCIADGYVPSDELSFEPLFYANESDLYTTAPHQVPDAFKWTNDYSEISELNVHGTLCSGDAADNSDYSWIMQNLANLKHIDLSDVNDIMLPKMALASGSLVTATLPSALQSAGDYVFGEDNTTICAITLPASSDAPNNLLDGISNPNVLIFVKGKRFAPSAQNFDANVIYGDLNNAEAISLTHAYPYFSPEDYHTASMVYTRQFTKETSIDGLGYGWETLCVPFAVQEVRRGDDVLEPFASDNLDGKPFWLFGANETDWERSTEIQANIPYLIAMPNNPWYEDEYNIAGTISFHASNVDVDASRTQYDGVGIGGGTYAHANYGVVPKSENMFALNQEEVTFYVSYMPGGVFARGLDDALPFECYLTSETGARFVKIFGNSNVEDILMGHGLRVWIEGKDVCLTNGINSRIRIFDTIGNLVRIADVKVGEVCRISDLYKGIYIIGTQKVYVK